MVNQVHAGFLFALGAIERKSKQDCILVDLDSGFTTTKWAENPTRTALRFVHTIPPLQTMKDRIEHRDLATPTICFRCVACLNRAVLTARQFRNTQNDGVLGYADHPTFDAASFTGAIPGLDFIRTHHVEQNGFRMFG